MLGKVLNSDVGYKQHRPKLACAGRDKKQETKAISRPLNGIRVWELDCHKESLMQFG